MLARTKKCAPFIVCMTFWCSMLAFGQEGLPRDGYDPLIPSIDSNIAHIKDCVDSMDQGMNNLPSIDTNIAHIDTNIAHMTGCVDSIMQNIDSGSAISTSITTIKDAVIYKDELHPLTTSKYTFFIGIAFAILGVLISLLSLIRGDPDLFQEIMRYKNFTTIWVPFKMHILVFIISSIVFLVICLAPAIDKSFSIRGDYFKGGCVFWIGTFLVLCCRLLYFILWNYPKKLYKQNIHY